jgi:hypothetical protein
MISIEETVDVGKQAVKNREIGVLAVVDFTYQVFHAVKHGGEVLVFALDYRNRAHVLSFIPWWMPDSSAGRYLCP